MMDVDQAAQAMQEAEIEAEIEDFLEGFNRPTYRTCGPMGSGWRPGRARPAGAVFRGRFVEAVDLIFVHLLHVEETRYFQLIEQRP
jgi:hypothetical protein